MSQRWEYKVAFVEGWERVSVEGKETHPEQGERNSAFGRRFLNQMGVEGWELTGIQHTMPGRSYYVFKRPIADGAEPDMSVVKRSEHAQPQAQGDAPSEGAGAQAVSL